MCEGIAAGKAEGVRGKVVRDDDDEVEASDGFRGEVRKSLW